MFINPWRARNALAEERKVAAACRRCGRTTKVGPIVKGTLVICPWCAAALEVVNTDPLKLAIAGDDDGDELGPPTHWAPHPRSRLGEE
jgi:lysine biosynthesis protein LysW